MVSFKDFVCLKVTRRTGVFPFSLFRFATQEKYRWPRVRACYLHGDNTDSVADLVKFHDDRLIKSRRSRKQTAASIQIRARELQSNLTKSRTKLLSLVHLERLIDFLRKYPLARQQIYHDDGIKDILLMRESSSDTDIIKQCRVALSLLGYADAVQGRGIRILSIDGGGTRGVMAIEMLKKIESLCNQPIHTLFDLIIGTSTGAILAMLIAVQKASLLQCEAMYARLSEDIFSTNRLLGAGKLFLNHAYYDSDKIESIFKQELGEMVMINTASAAHNVKVACVSTVVNQPALQSYVFRNYCLRPDVKQAYMGSSTHKMWQALRASTAAPGFFEEYMLDEYVHQDGGLLTNNPCAVGIHEAKALWPSTPIQAVVSLGTGMYHGRAGPHTAQFSTLKAKLMKLVASATDVEAIHIILQDLLPESSYVRLNPNMSLDVALDECQPHVLEQLKQDSRNYINKFHHKFEHAANILCVGKRPTDKWKDTIKFNRILYGSRSKQR